MPDDNESKGPYDSLASKQRHFRGLARAPDGSIDEAVANELCIQNTGHDLHGRSVDATRPYNQGDEKREEGDRFVYRVTKAPHLRVVVDPEEVPEDE
jgi:hypothetical protein